MKRTTGPTGRFSRSPLPRTRRRRRAGSAALSRPRSLLGAERLETRTLLAADAAAWHNQDLPEDVSGDALVTPFDALLVINSLNQHGSRDLSGEAPAAWKLDVSGDNYLSPIDAALILNELNDAEGEDGPLVRIRLETTPVDSEESLSVIGLGEDFLLRAYVQDLTARTDGGVFAAYLDVTYDPNLVEVAGAIEHGEEYGNASSGDPSVAGVIDEIGSADGLDPLGTSEVLLFSIPMRSRSEFGNFSFLPDPADDSPAHDVLVFGLPMGMDTPIVPAERIEFLGAPLQIGSGSPPLARDDGYSGLEDQTLIVDLGFGVLVNDEDPDGDVLTAQLGTEPTQGTLTLNVDGSLVYRPNENFNGVDSFTYFANDGQFDSEPATVTLEVEAVNDAPVVTDETYSVAVDGILTVDAGNGVLANDFDIEGSPITAELVTETTEGEVTLNADGSFQYTPNPGFMGTDTFAYVASDGDRSSVVATATITVGEVAGPVAVDDNYSVDEDVDLVVTAIDGVLANDENDSGGTLTAQLVTEPSNGAVTLNADGSFTYVPNADFHGTDSFTYAASDVALSSDGTVTITVQPVNDAPVGVNDSYTVASDTTLSTDAAGGVLANDQDVDGDSLTAELIDDPASGSLTLNTDGSFEYTPNQGFNGLDSFTYMASDGSASSELTTVTIAVGSVEPIVVIDLVTTDLDGNPISTIGIGEQFLLRAFVQDVSPEPQDGVFAAYLDVTYDATLATVSGNLTPGANYPNGVSGDTSMAGLIDEAGAFDGLSALGGDRLLLFSLPFTSQADGQLDFVGNPADVTPQHFVLLFNESDEVPVERIQYGTATITILGRTDPEAVDDSYTLVDEDVLVVSADQGVLANDLGVSGTTLTAVLADDVQHGTLALGDDGSFTYTPDSGFAGVDTFTYRAVANEIPSELATVTITVGDFTPSTVSGFVYADTDNDGEKDSVERTFGDVEIQLTGTDVFGSSVSMVTRTARDGSYAFSNLLRGTYTVSEVHPEMLLDGRDTYGGQDSPLDDAFAIDLGPGESLGGYNFGERGLLPEYITIRPFFSSAPPEGFTATTGSEGDHSWYSFDSGWDAYRSVQVSVSNNGLTVQIMAVDGAGDVFSATARVVNNSSQVQVTGDAEHGYVVRLGGASTSFSLQRTGASGEQAVDAAFAEGI